MKPRSILVATDFSAHARHAALRAGMLARALGMRKLVLLHAMPRFTLALGDQTRAMRAARGELKRMAEELRRDTGVGFTPRLVHGSVVGELVRASAASDLIVVGVRGASPLRDLAIGTTAERLVRKSRRPVLVVKSRPRDEYRRVLVPVDFSPDSRTALKQVAAIAPAAGLTLLHAYELPFEGQLKLGGASSADIERYRRQARDLAIARMGDMTRTLGLASRESGRICARAYPPKLIQDSAADLRADLIAIGKHGGSMLEDLLLGSVTQHVLSESDCDVLVVPSQRR